MATPSTLGSQEKASASRSRSGACRRSRSPQARSSSSSEGVVEAHHRDPVADLLEQARGRRADGVRRRVGRRQRGVVRLELPQLHDEEVVLGVGDLGRIERVVQLVVVHDQRAQLLGPRSRLLRDRRRPRQRSRPCRPRSGGDAGAHDGVGVERVVERHRLARAPRAAAGRRSGPPCRRRPAAAPGARHGAPVRADLRHRPGPGGERPVDPGERRPGQHHRRRATPRPRCPRSPAAPPRRRASRSAACRRCRGPCRAAGPP